MVRRGWPVADGSKCHEKLLVRIGGGSCGKKTSTADRRASVKRFDDMSLSAASLVMNAKFCCDDGSGSDTAARQPSTYLEEMNTKMQGRFQKAANSASSWPRCGHKTYPPTAAATTITTTPAVRKYQLLKSCADIKRDKAAAAAVASEAASAAAVADDVVGALDDLSRTIDRHLAADRAQHVTLIQVRQHTDRRRDIRGRLEYVKDLMSTDETSEESLKADEEVRSYMARADDDDEDQHLDQPPPPPPPPAECENLKKLISTVKKNSKQPVRSAKGTQYKYIDKTPTKRNGSL